MIRKAVRFLDSRTGTAPLVKKALRYVFPDHWSFLLGEVALYTFIVLVGTGIYLTLFFEPTEPGRALVCPCHYSTFDPAAGGKVLFCPAGRPLPQLPLAIRPDRRLVAAGDYAGPPGPSWWGVRNA